MTARILSPVFLLLPALLLPTATRAQDDELGRMREALRTTVVQLRDVTNRLALVEAEKQAEKAAADEKIADLEEQVKTLTLRAIQDKEAADIAKANAEKAIATLQERTAEQDMVIGELQTQLKTVNKEREDAIAKIRDADAEKAEAVSKAVVLQRRVDSALFTNAELYRIATEVLDKYESFGLGEAITARQKFIGITRTKFENMMQDYGDSIDAQRIPLPEQ